MSKFVINKSSLLFIILVLLPISNMISVPVLGYADELLAIWGILYILLNIKKLNYSRYIKRLVLLICMLLGIGLFSNWYARYVTDAKTILLDFFLIAKPYVVFIGCLLLKQSYKDNIINKLFPLCKIMLCVLFTCSVITQFQDIGMTLESDKVGPLTIHIFGFIWKNGIQTAWLTIICYACILSCEVKTKKLRFYTVAYFVTLLTIWGGFVSIMFLSSAAFLYYFKNDKKAKLNFWQLGLCAVAGGVFAFGDITRYLSNSYAPRALYIKYGIVTANRFFPFGAGIGTYGSEMANRLYSPLYYEYGFNSIWSMSPTSIENQFTTLYDNYIAMIFGEYGWMGFLIFCIFLVTIFIVINKSNTTGNRKAIALSMFITLCATMLVSATSKSTMGVMTFALIGLLIKNSKKEPENYSI